MPNTLKIRDALVQVALRMIPILPANEMKVLFEALVKRDSEIEKQVSDAIEALKSTSNLIAQLEQSVQQKTGRLVKLQDEYKQYVQLTTLTREQVASLSSMMSETLEKSRTREILTHLGMHLGVGLVFLVLGVILAHPIENLWKSLFSS
jgi:hypothetical protein